MGADAEPFTVMNLIGLIFVIIGFLAYSGFGFASNFIVVQVLTPLPLSLSLSLFPLSLSPSH
jgi:hypothetical protein